MLITDLETEISYTIHFKNITPKDLPGHLESIAIQLRTDIDNGDPSILNIDSIDGNVQFRTHPKDTALSIIMNQRRMYGPKKDRGKCGVTPQDSQRVG